MHHIWIVYNGWLHYQLIQNLIDNTEDKSFINKNIKLDLAIEKIFFDNENNHYGRKG